MDTAPPDGSDTEQARGESPPESELSFRITGSPEQYEGRTERTDRILLVVAVVGLLLLVGGLVWLSYWGL